MAECVTINGKKYFYVSLGWKGLYLTEQEFNRALKRYMSMTYGKMKLSETIGPTDMKSWRI